MEIGEHIAHARKVKGLSQTAAAKLIGCDRATLAQWEMGRKLPHPRNLDRLWQVLDLPATVAAEITIQRFTRSAPRPSDDPIQNTITRVTAAGYINGLRLLLADADNMVKLCKAITALQDLQPGTPEAVETLAKAFTSATQIFITATTTQIESGKVEEED